VVFETYLNSIVTEMSENNTKEDKEAEESRKFIYHELKDIFEIPELNTDSYLVDVSQSSSIHTLLLASKKFKNILIQSSIDNRDELINWLTHEDSVQAGLLTELMKGSDNSNSEPINENEAKQSIREIVDVFDSKKWIQKFSCILSINYNLQTMPFNESYLNDILKLLSDHKTHLIICGRLDLSKVSLNDIEKYLNDNDLQISRLSSLSDYKYESFSIIATRALYS
jgi:hypothetical protein